ncbi:dTDP-4-dehydrorhamnose reductase [Flavobacteriaceae bacterium]|nr:dTDP-4-dehydrorhamnose reductase [Flavobacteriaceae bacterium]
MKILVTGAKGQLGSELKNNPLIKNNSDWFFTDRQSFNISDLDNINVFLDMCKPNIIINCAAYTSVDKAEDDFEFANIVNNEAISLIAKWCNDNNCNLIHISTDYVYNGYSKTPYIEEDQTDPLNNYGKTKLLGDIGCQKNNPSCIIIRTSWLYSSFGNNFLKKMINIMQVNDEIKVVDDQFGSPTYAGDLASTILVLIKNKKWNSSIYNYTNKGYISWYDFANQIKSIYGFSTIVKPISTKEYSQKVTRPKYSSLDNSKIINTFKIKQMGYLDSLKKCIKILKNES